MSSDDESVASGRGKGSKEEASDRKGFLCSIAQPLAGKKLHKKVYKLVKKASEEKKLKRGVKEVVKSIRKGAKGLCIIAGDISPLDVVSHLPVFCEESGVQYVFVTSKSELGASAKTKRPTSCVLVPREEAVGYTKKLKEAVEEVVSITPKFA